MDLFGFPKGGKPILVAVSGGVDSMVLTTLLHEGGYNIAVAHCNYGLRAEDSDADEQVVRQWCAERRIEFQIKAVDTMKLVRETNASIQMVARDERYGFFKELMETNGYSVTALAHHANDRVESLIINLLRGTGYRGFMGMPSQRDGFIRPMLGFTKNEIRAFAENHNVPFREDRSNAETYYQRNWVRLKLLPMLLATDPKAFEKLLRFAERAEAQLPEYEHFVNGQLQKLVSESEVSVDALKACSVPFTMLKEALEPLGFNSEQIFEVLQLRDSATGSVVSSNTHRVLKDRNRLVISELKTNDNAPLIVCETVQRSSLDTLVTESNVVLMDADALRFSLPNGILTYGITGFELRKWRIGDRFKPLGMNGWKLLSDFFIDQKYSVLEKEQTWLLTFQGEVVWVVGKRLDNRFRVTSNTKKVLKLTASL